MSLTCPLCGSVNPPSTGKCDCGYHFRKKEAVWCFVCCAPIDLDDEKSYSRVNLDYVCRTCALRRLVEKTNADWEGRKKLTGHLILLFFALTLAIPVFMHRVVGFGGALIALIFIVMAVIGVFSCILWLRKYGGDLPDPGTSYSPYSDVGAGVAVVAFTWALVIVGVVIMTFR
jgi:hypothetical protein